MDKYQPWTKIVTDNNGEEYVACAYLGTDVCRAIHNDENFNCCGCKVFEAILVQLNAFENIVLNANKKNAE